MNKIRQGPQPHGNHSLLERKNIYQRKTNIKIYNSNKCFEKEILRPWNKLMESDDQRSQETSLGNSYVSRDLQKDSKEFEWEERKIWNKRSCIGKVLIQDLVGSWHWMKTSSKTCSKLLCCLWSPAECRHHCAWMLLARVVHVQGHSILKATSTYKLGKMQA